MIICKTCHPTVLVFLFLNMREVFLFPVASSGFLVDVTHGKCKIGTRSADCQVERWLIARCQLRCVDCFCSAGVSPTCYLLGKLHLRASYQSNQIWLKSWTRASKVATGRARAARRTTTCCQFANFALDNVKFDDSMMLLAFDSSKTQDPWNYWQLRHKPSIV